MKFCNYISSILCMLLLLSCSLGGAYPYTTIDGDIYETRIYTLPNAARLYLTKNDIQPRVAAALLLPAANADTIETLYTPSVHSADYAALFARIGSHGAYIVETGQGRAILTDIPCNEIENWATIMRGSFSALPDSFSIVISGDIIFDDVVATIEKQFSDIALYGTAPSVRGEDDTHMLFALHPDADAMRKRAKEGVLRVEDVESLKENYLFALADGFFDNTFRVRMIADALLRGAACNSVVLLADNLEKVDKKMLAASSSRLCRMEKMCPQVHPGAENSISLSSPLPAKVSFPDAEELCKENTFSENTHDGFCRILLHVDYSGIPSTVATIAAQYLHEALAGSEPQIGVELFGKSLLIEFHFAAETGEKSVEKAMTALGGVVDSERFYRYLQQNGDALLAGKTSPTNIAAQTAEYLKGGKRSTGLHNLATLSMQRIFSSSTSPLAIGTEAEKLLPLLKPHFTVAAPQNMGITAPADESAPEYMLVAMDCDTLYTLTAAPVDGVGDKATILLFNKAAELSRTDTLVRYSHNGACLAMGAAWKESLPFSEEYFDAARSLLIYDLSTYAKTPQAAVREYLLGKQWGCSSSELYDALCGISYSDAKDFCRWHRKASAVNIVVGKGSSPELRNLAAKEKVAYITLDELFGY